MRIHCIQVQMSATQSAAVVVDEALAVFYDWGGEEGEKNDL